jgi:hypothetical protein
MTSSLNLQSQSPVYEYAYNHKGTIGFSEIIAMPPWKATLKVIKPVKPSFKYGFKNFGFHGYYLYLGCEGIKKSE